MPDYSVTQHLPWRVADASNKATAVANHCFYKIAMGKWPPGTKLPAVRRLEKEWSVNRLTILKAYNALADRGLVDHRPNGSYYVAEAGFRRNFTADRIELDALYRAVHARITRQTELSPLGVLRALVRIAESELSENPDVAFVECSRSQAADHAREIAERLHIPVLPLTLDDIRGKKMRLPPSVRTVFTTSFHVDELADLRDDGTEVVALPIELSPGILSTIERRRREVVFLETDENFARRTARDAIWMAGIDRPHVEVAPDFDRFLSAKLDAPEPEEADILFLVPQKEWEVLPAKWRGHPSVTPITCVLNDAAWALIVEGLKIPFGESIGRDL